MYNKLVYIGETAYWKTPYGLEVAEIENGEPVWHTELREAH